MTIVSATFQVPVGNPPAAISLDAPVGIGSTVAIRIGNYSPFPMILSGVNDAPASAPTLPPYTQNWWQFSNVRGPVVARAIALDPSASLPMTMMLFAEFTDSTSDFAGTYPVNLPGEVTVNIGSGSTVNISGPVEIENTTNETLMVNQPSTTLGTNVFSFPAGGGVLTWNVPNPFTLDIHAVGIKAYYYTGSRFVRLRVVGNTTATIYYAGYPYAGDIDDPLWTNFVIIPYGAISDSRFTIEAYLPAGAPATDVTLSVMGYLEAVDAYQYESPSLLIVSDTQSGTGSVTLLPAITNGGYYRIDAIDLALEGGAGDTAAVDINGIDVIGIYVAGSKALSFPRGVITNQDVNLTVAGGDAQASVVYAYRN